MPNYVLAARDNVYNNENDFDTVFTWSVWTTEADRDSDWIWNKDTAYLAICRHKGGDVRGNYGVAEVYPMDGTGYNSIGECGFLDWTIGWHVWRIPRDTTLTSEELTDELAKEIISHCNGDTFEDERLTERCSPGYSSHPTSELYSECGTENCYWYNGYAILGEEGATDWIVAQPYSPNYNSDVNTPDNGTGWTCDAELDFDSWLAYVVNDEDDIADKIADSTDREFKIEWDNDDAIGEYLSAQYDCDSCGETFDLRHGSHIETEDGIVCEGCE